MAPTSAIPINYTTFRQGLSIRTFDYGMVLYGLLLPGLPYGGFVAGDPHLLRATGLFVVIDGFRNCEVYSNPK